MACVCLDNFGWPLSTSHARPAVSPSPPSCPHPEAMWGLHTGFGACSRNRYVGKAKRPWGMPPGQGFCLAFFSRQVTAAALPLPSCVSLPLWALVSLIIKQRS